MVLVLDDMVNGVEITVRGICMEMIERMKTLGLCVTPTDGDRQLDIRDTPEAWQKWARWGLFDFHTPSAPHPICYAAAFDPDAFKRVSYDILRESGVKLRTHSWFSSAIVENGTIKGVVCQTKSGREAIMGDVVIDASGDLDVAADAGAQHTDGNFILTTVSRWGGIDTEAAERFEFEEPEKFKAIDHEAKRLIGGCWSFWWLKTPLPGVIWLNCPHMPKLSGLRVEDLTYAELEGRGRIARLLERPAEQVEEHRIVAVDEERLGVRFARTQLIALAQVHLAQAGERIPVPPIAAPRPRIPPCCGWVRCRRFRPRSGKPADWPAIRWGC